MWVVEKIKKGFFCPPWIKSQNQTSNMKAFWIEFDWIPSLLSLAVNKQKQICLMSNTTRVSHLSVSSEIPAPEHNISRKTTRWSRDERVVFGQRREDKPEQNICKLCATLSLNQVRRLHVTYIGCNYVWLQHLLISGSKCVTHVCVVFVCVSVRESATLQLIITCLFLFLFFHNQLPKSFGEPL